LGKCNSLREEAFLLPLSRPRHWGNSNPQGGFRLARPADKITLLEIVEAVDGPIRGEDLFADRLGGSYKRFATPWPCRSAGPWGRVRLSDLAAAVGGKAGGR
jgi:hypothetical protein